MTTSTFPVKLTPRRPMTSAKQRNGEPQKVPMVMRALMMPYVLPAYPKPKKSCQESYELTPLMTAQSMP